MTDRPLTDGPTMDKPVTDRPRKLPVVHLAREASTLGDLFRRRALRNPERAAFFEKRAGAWVATTWSEFYDRSARVARALVSLGVAPGERVAILGPTRAPWACYDMGAQLAGAVSYGIYPQQTATQIRYLLEHSDARVVFVDGADELENVLEAARGLSCLAAIVPWDEASAARAASRDARVVPPSRFAQGPLSPSEIEARIAATNPEDTALLVYTSGTTGAPKGAMISHRNVLAVLGAQESTIEWFEDDISLSFLPMAHVAERVLAFYGRISTGIATAYASSTGAVLTELAEVRPTVFGSVPRIFEKAYSRIQSEMQKKPPAVRRLFAWATDVGRRRIRLVLDGKPVPFGLALQHGIADRLVFKKIRAAFGGRVRCFITGAAPTSIEILEFFWAAGLPIFEAFGMTEATVITHINSPHAVRLGSVGRCIAPMEHRIAEDGELLLRGPWVFKGYFKNEAATAETIVDGWLHTGDIATIDSDGYLRITDRKKHLIITAGGKNLTPANIENAIKNEDPLISHVHAHGDRRPYISAVVAPSPLETLELGADRGLITKVELDERVRELMENPAARSAALERCMAAIVVDASFRARIREAVKRGNTRLAHVEQVRRFYILDRDFSQERGELTPTLKLKRKEIERSYEPVFERIYEEKGFAVDVT